MKKEFEKAEVEIITFDEKDVITTSGNGFQETGEVGGEGMTEE